jgi:predicted MFS family arabinose efflux permease
VQSIPTEGPRKRTSLRRYLKLITQPDLLRFMPAWLAINAILGVWLNHLSFQMSGVQPDPDQFLVGGFSGSLIGVVLAMYALTFSAGILLWSRAFGRMRKTDMMLIALGGLFVVCLSSFAINHTARSNPAIVAILLVPLAAGILVESGFTPAALGYLADLSERYATDRGAIMGLYSVLLGLGQLGGAWLGGPFADWGRMDGIILLTALLGLISFITVLHLRYTHKDFGTPRLTDAG